MSAIVNVIAGNGVEDHDRYVSRYGIIYRRLARAVPSGGRSAKSTWPSMRIRDIASRRPVVLALIFDMPIELAESAIFAEDPGFLLLACRSNHFAWSTVAAILALSPGRMQDKLFAMQCCEDYHALTTADAQRFMRLLRVNLQSRLQAPAQTLAEFRTNVR